MDNFYKRNIHPESLFHSIGSQWSAGAGILKGAPSEGIAARTFRGGKKVEPPRRPSKIQLCRDGSAEYFTRQKGRQGALHPFSR